MVALRFHPPLGDQPAIPTRRQRRLVLKCSAASRVPRQGTQALQEKGIDLNGSSNAARAGHAAVSAGSSRSACIRAAPSERQGHLPAAVGPMNYTCADLQKLVTKRATPAAALATRSTRSRAKDDTFQMGDFKMLFTAANFVLSFSLPNLFFHATTAYDMLRMKGAPLGKIDFLGQLRIGA
jgi:hypothetical protein